ncbi:hypothetical protein AN958_09357 [Leucoagaricus sp. SymC.cos]|nr:hypothetical protein AN958_09357 [Leucoagaricus sp. SymC.cos]
MRLILSGRHPRNSTYTNSQTGEILYKVDKPRKLGPGTATIRKAVRTVGGVWRGPDNGIGESSSSSSGRPQNGTRKSSVGSWPTATTISTSDKCDTVLDSSKGEERRSVDEEFAIDSDDEAVVKGSASASGRGEQVPAFEGHFAFYAQIEFKRFLSTRFRYDSLDVSVSEYFRKGGWSWYGRRRVFKAKDGKDYGWEMRVNCLMVKNDSGPRTKKQIMARYKPYRPALGPLKKYCPAYLEVDDSCEGILDEIVMTFVYCHKLRKDRERVSWNNGVASGITWSLYDVLLTFNCRIEKLC